MQIEYEIIKRIYPSSIINKYLNKNRLLNNNDNSYVTNFLFIKLFASILIFILSFILINRNLVVSIICVLLFNYIYGYFAFDKKLKLREKTLEKEAGLFFEVLVLSLKSGKNLIDSFYLTTSNLDSMISLEIKDNLESMKYGKSIIEVLDDYSKCVPSEAIRNILEGIIESYTSGKDMIYSIEKELKLLSNKRIFEIKGYINKLPIKISVISVFILIPLMLLLILSPVILDLLG